MRRHDTPSDESGLNRIIALLMVAGISAGVLLLTVGMVLYWRTHGGLSVSTKTAVFIHGQDLFSLLYDMVRGAGARRGDILLLTLGIVVLMLTPLLRVVVSVVFFAWHRDYKYVVITLLVLVILTLSLMLH
jgi:uncharacterized membrane protein